MGTAKPGAEKPHQRGSYAWSRTSIGRKKSRNSQVRDPLGPVTAPSGLVAAHPFKRSKDVGGAVLSCGPGIFH